MSCLDPEKASETTKAPEAAEAPKTTKTAEAALRSEIHLV